ncbi:MAG TPA: sialidase family protein [Mycobacteriales bacterium]|nr:sialidase family protein [Mycobacteriales bacterium]
MRREAGLLAVAAAMAVVIGGAPQGSAAPTCPSQQTKRTGSFGTWTTLKVPAFPIGPVEATAHAVDPVDGRRWWVTNGVVLSRSTDAGCTWKTVFELPETPTADVPASRQTDRIRVLAVPSTREAHENVVAAVEANSVFSNPLGTEGDATALSGTIILAGTDTLRLLGPLAAPAGPPGPLVIAPSDHRTLYAVAGGRVNVSDDAGQTWRLATPQETVDSGDPPAVGTLPTPQVFPPVTRLAVDPLDPKALWARSDDRIYRSVDGGTTYAPVIDAAGGATFPLLEVTRPPRGVPRVVVGDQRSPTSPLRALRVADDGKTFKTRRTIGADLGLVTGSVTSSASGPARTDLVFTTAEPTGAGSQVYLYFPSLDQVRPVDEFRLGPLRDVQRTRVGPVAFVFRTSSLLVRWEPQLAFAFPPKPPAVPELGEFGSADGRVRQLTESSRVVGPEVVRLAKGETREIPLRLELSPEPTPLDVFFLLDTSGSMDDVIDGLARDFEGVSKKLEEAGIDAFFGLGDYQDTGGVRYRRLVDIQPPGDPLRRALNSILTNGGDEPAYTALHQVSTGSGIPAPTEGRAVPRGSGASWRPGSLRVIVHATDEVPSSDASGFTQSQAVFAMQVDETRHVGIAVAPRENSPRNIGESNIITNERLIDILRAMSRDTGALAPEGGIDCDGDGRIDIQAEQPLVCELTSQQNRIDLAPALLQVLSSLVDMQRPNVLVGGAAQTKALAAQLSGPPGVSTVDVKRTNALDYSLRVTCAESLTGQTVPLQLRPAVGARVGRASPLNVVCGVAPKPSPAPLPPLIPPAAAVLAVPVLPPLPVPPPAPAPVGAQAAAPAGAPVAVTAVQPGVALGLAPEEEQAQLAYAEQRDLEEAGKLGQELAMVARSPAPDQLALRLAAMGLLCAAATGVAMRRREAVRPRRAS